MAKTIGLINGRGWQHFKRFHCIHTLVVFNIASNEA